MVEQNFVNNNITCLILAGGLGTRLRGVLPDLPKPMAPVNGRPFLEYLIEQVRAAGYHDVVLCVGHKAEAIEKYFGDGSEFGVSIRYSREEELLGTAGAVKLAEDLIVSDQFLLINGDCWCDVDLNSFAEQHQSTLAKVTLVATEVDDRSRFGSLKISEDGTIVKFTEKGIDGPGYINAGYYILQRSALEPLPAGRKISLEEDVLFPMIGDGLYAFRTKSTFIDIGVPEDWRRAGDVLEGKSR